MTISILLAQQIAQLFLMIFMGFLIVKAGLLKDDKVHTTLALVHTYPDGDRDFSFYRNPGADMMLTEEELTANLKNAANYIKESKDLKN